MAEINASNRDTGFPSRKRASAWRQAFACALASLGITACGGGGGSEPAPNLQPTPTPSVATVSLSTPADGKVPWNLSAPMSVALKDSAGAVVANPSCAAADASKLSVAADCSSAKGLRLGSQTIVVSGSGASASVTVTVTPQRQPIATHGETNSSGLDYNLIVTPQGRVLAWGANVSAGTLGQGSDSNTLASSALPLAVKDETGTGELSGIVSASAGNQFALALTEGGEVLAWGANGNRQLARDGVENGSALPGKVRNPANNGNLGGVVEISAGDSNAVALLDDGTVLSWGDYPGQGAAVGTGPSRYPNTVQDPSGAGGLSGIVAVSAGWNYSLALGADGKVYAWGWNASAETGNLPAGAGPGGPPEMVAKTVKRASDGAALDNIVAISAGYNFALALTADGNVYAWGANGNGQLAQNAANYEPNLAVQVKGLGGTGILSNIAMVAAGGNHALAMDKSGAVYSWGYAQASALGDGANRPVVNLSTVPIRVVSEASTGSLSGVVSIAAGYRHSLALKADGTVLIWGSGFRGNLAQGSGSSADLAVPTPAKNSSGAAALSIAPLSSYPNLLRKGR